MLTPVIRTNPRALKAHTALIVDIRAENLRVPSTSPMNIYTLEVEVLAGRGFRARHPRSNVIFACALKIVPGNIGDADLGCVAIFEAVRARRDVDGLADVFQLEIAERDVAHMTDPRVRLDVSGIFRVN